MDFPELVRGRFIKRYKRFFVDVELDDGQVVTAHCANTGSMKSILDPAPRCWLSRARPGRKLAYTWEVAEQDDTRIYVNPAGANRVVAEAIGRGVIEELRGYDIIQSEVKYGDGSRVDFVLSGARGRAYVEVKNVTLGYGDGRVAFPDAVTERGTKHLRELCDVARRGDRAVLLFCAGRTDARSVHAASEIDATYAATLAEVARSGVEVIAYGGKITPAEFTLAEKLPVVVPTLG
jgi:sugar fermentation stimulation protein A